MSMTSVKLPLTGEVVVFEIDESKITWENTYLNDSERLIIKLYYDDIYLQTYSALTKVPDKLEQPGKELLLFWLETRVRQGRLIERNGKKYKDGNTLKM